MFFFIVIFKIVIIYLFVNFWICFIVFLGFIYFDIFKYSMRFFNVKVKIFVYRKGKF